MLVTKRDIRFLLAFVSAYMAFYLAYFQISDQYLRTAIYNLILDSSAFLINLFTTTYAASVYENHLYANSQATSMELVRGCDASGNIFLLLAGIIAYQSKMKWKILGIVAAMLFVYLLNQMRLIGLYFILVLNPKLFSMAHVYFMPTAMIAISCIFYLIWISLVKSYEQDIA